MDWQIYLLPMDQEFILSLKKKSAGSGNNNFFYKGNFDLKETADTYIDMSNYTKGVVWVNGHNLGRYWNAGPQFHLYCPAQWLVKGNNTVIVFDLIQQQAASIKGVKTLY